MDVNLKAVRAGHKSAVTRLLRKTEEENIDDEESAEILETLLEKQKTISDLNKEILKTTKAEDIEEEIIQTDEYKIFLNTKIRHLRKKKANATQSTTHENNSENRTNISISQNESTTPYNSMENTNQHSSTQFSTQTFHVPQTNSHLHLPKLTLPTFNGDILMWQTFWDTFESSVHFNISLTDVQKFTYLKSQLMNEAASTIDGLPLTNTNYMEVVKLLKERFGQTHKITNAYMQALLEIRAPQNNIQSLRTYYDKLESYIRGLETLGRSGDSYGALLIPIILNKLPSEVRQHLARENGSDNWELDTLRQGILKEVNILEAGQRTQSATDRYQYAPATASFLTNTNTKSKHNTHANNTTARNTNSTNIRQKPCVFCEHLHDPAKCPTVVDYDTRLSIVKQKRLCFNCLGTHRSIDCKSKFRCRQCKKKHHTSLCNEITSSPQDTSVNTITNNETIPETTASFHSSTVQSRSNVLLKTAVAPVWGRKESYDSHILFDEGAQRSFVTEEIATKLDIEILGTETIHLSAFGNTENKVRVLNKGRIHVESVNGTKIPVDVLVVPTIASPLTNFMGKTIGEFKYRRGLRLAHPISSDSTFEISLLIGADFYWDFIEDTIIRGNGPTAVKSKVGYLLSGPIPNLNRPQKNIGMYNILTGHKPEEFNLEKFWKLESLGVDNNIIEDDNLEYLTKYQISSIEFRETRYVAKLPWKPEHETLPSNFAITKRRTENVIKKLSKTPDMLQMYGQIIKDQERRGFVEKVVDTKNNAGRIHYIPHHPVKKDSSTTPIRIVYDCSCRESHQSSSLNDCLMNTPPILNDLTKILIRFRLNPVAIVTDIEKAFLNVGLHEQDRDVTRFLWLSEPNDPTSKLVTYRFRSVLFGATCSPFILTAVLLKHLHTTETETAKMIERDIYVDNILSSVKDEKEAITYYTESRQLMQKAGFNLRSWTSNNSKLRDIASKENVLDSDTETKILGMRWNVENDELSYAKQKIKNVVQEPTHITKREILKESSKIFDPLGLLSPVSIRAKILIQDLWKGGYDWDEPLPTHLQREWTDLANDIQRATEITFQRQYFGEKGNSNILHVFVDASIKAYGAVAYLQNGQDTTLVMAKTRVAPVKELTLPQLELMAAVIGARLTKHIQSTLKCTKVTLWSDSQIVLSWLRTTKPVKRFVSNRIKEIQELTAGCNWNYCPTDCNPADLLTRGLTAKQFIGNLLWKRGPSSVIHESAIPTFNVDTNTILPVFADDEEDTTETDKRDQTGIDKVMNIQDYGTYQRLSRVTAYVLRFIENCKLTRNSRNTGPLTPDEIQISTKLWIKHCQIGTFQNEINALVKHEVTNKLPRIRQLRLYLDEDELVRCRGRIHNAPVCDTAKFPYLLPANHRFSELLILDSHNQVLHSGVSATIAQVRQTYWIPSIRQMTRRLLHKCTICKKVTGKPYRAPDPPPLQKVRLQEAPPFTVTGVDFTGSLQIRDKNGTLTKAYICLFTCASTRAVHLEVIPNMTEETFLMAFRRFTCRKSIPQIMISDNAATFTSAFREIKQLYESEKIGGDSSRSAPHGLDDGGRG